MYASDILRGRLYTIDLQTAAVTLVGPFNNPDGVQIGTGLAYDPTLGLFAVDNGSSNYGSDRLYRIDPMTGQATLVGAMSTMNVLGLAFIPEPTTLGLLALGGLAVLRRRLVTTACHDEAQRRRKPQGEDGKRGACR